MSHPPLPRTLLVTSASPVIQSAGSVFLKTLVEPQSERFSWFVVAPRDSPAEHFLQAPLEYAYPPAAPRTGSPPPKTLAFRLKHWVRQWFGEGPSRLWKQIPLLRQQAPALAETIVRACHRDQIEVVWFVIDSTPLLTYVVHELSQRWSGRLAINIHDPPTRDADALVFPFKWALESLIMRRLEPALQRASAVAVASWNMRKLYQVPQAEVLIHGPDLEQIRPPSTSFKTEGLMRIGFAGSLYAQETWQHFLDALEAAQWRIGDRQVKISLLGNWKPGPERSLSEHVECLGWATPERCLEVLSDCDITYLPYWFGHDSSVQNCFPNKLSMYLAAGIPVFYHGPRPSSPDDFLRQYQAGVSCNSTDSPVILKALSRFLEASQYQAFAQEAHRAACQELNSSVFHAAFQRFLMQAVLQK